MPLLLNCDLGESFGAWSMGMDEMVMPHIDQANIACGFHAGDPLVMQKTLKLAGDNGVTVGAHPAYPDLMGFGRRSIHASANEIHALIHYQVAALDGMAASAGLQLTYVKPHGALYNDMMAKPSVRQAIMKAIADYHRPLKLMLQATPEAESHLAEAAHFGIELLFEAFADPVLRRRWQAALAHQTGGGTQPGEDAGPGAPAGPRRQRHHRQRQAAQPAGGHSLRPW